MTTQRAHPRYAIELDAILEVEGSARPVHGRTQDISIGGFSLQAPNETTTVEPGTRCLVKLALVFSETEFSEQLTLRATVAWFTRLKKGVQLGVKLEALDPQSRQYLGLFIKFLEEGREPAEPESEDDVPDPGEP